MTALFPTQTPEVNRSENSGNENVQIWPWPLRKLAPAALLMLPSAGPLCSVTPLFCFFLNRQGGQGFPLYPTPEVHQTFVLVNP